MKQEEITTPNTRTRILDVAGEVFAEMGYWHVTIREICKRATVNVAAINYHFGDKKGLYLAVLRQCRDKASQKYPFREEGDEATPAEIRLARFVRAFLLRILGEGDYSYFGKLIAREYFEPTGALDVLVEEVMKPTFETLSIIVRDLAGAQVKEETVRLSCASVVSQCLFHYYARPVITRLFGKKALADEEKERIADQIAIFSTAGIRTLARGQGGDRA
jgi:TetR/AcrR family transcriptional regulator, regulator of cefoperazone and chloramphenicol sensitivity